jgi:hypothetical protein
MIKDDDEDLNDQLTNKWRREADKIINKQNYKVHRNRKALVDAIRLLETAITSAENDNFKY